MNKFLVLHKEMRAVRVFNTAHEVSVFMWGRTVAAYDIYILAGDVNPLDVDDLRKKLEVIESKIYA